MTNDIEGKVREILYDNFAQTQWEGMGGSPNVKSIGQTVIVNQAQLDRALSSILSLTTNPLDENSIWECLAKAQGCKPNKEDCSFKRCHSWGRCENIREVFCSHFSKQIKYPEKKGLLPNPKSYADEMFNREMEQYNQAIDDMRRINGEQL